MPLIASKTTRPVVPEGTYPARCIDVYDAGWWQKMDSDEYVQKCKVVFVLDTSEADGFVDDTGQQIPRAYIDLFESLTLGEKANLRKHLVSWRGKQFTADELKSFDLETQLNKTAMVQVIHKQKQDGSVRANVGTITPLHRSIKAPDVPRDYVPDAEREKSFASEHPKPKAKDAPAPREVGAGGAGLEDDEDELPFSAE